MQGEEDEEDARAAPGPSGGRQRTKEAYDHAGKHASFPLRPSCAAVHVQTWMSSRPAAPGASNAQDDSSSSPELLRSCRSPGQGRGGGSRQGGSGGQSGRRDCSKSQGARAGCRTGCRAGCRAGCQESKKGGAGGKKSKGKGACALSRTPCGPVAMMVVMCDVPGTCLVCSDTKVWWWQGGGTVARGVQWLRAGPVTSRQAGKFTDLLTRRRLVYRPGRLQGSLTGRSLP
jgi:hypothetical protein